MKQKFLLASVVVLLISLTTKAQIGKGSVWLGGNIGYGSSRSTGVSPINNPSSYAKSNSFWIAPAIGKAVKDNLILGISLTYQNVHYSNYAQYEKDNENYYGAGFFVRQYVPVLNRLYLFGQGNINFRYSKSEADLNSNYPSNTHNETKGWSAGLGFQPGVSFALNKKWQLETGFNNLLSVQYQSTKETSNYVQYNGKNQQFSAGLNLDNASSFYVGFRILLNSKG